LLELCLRIATQGSCTLKGLTQVLSDTQQTLTQVSADTTRRSNPSSPSYPDLSAALVILAERGHEIRLAIDVQPV